MNPTLRLPIFLMMLACAPSTVVAVTIPTVPVGNAGNAGDLQVLPDLTTGHGAVNYDYRIGTTEVTVGQYTAFLNAVAATDTYALYNPDMAANVYVPSIARSGSAGSYTYSVIGSANKPVTFVSWGDAARFANWLHNGQPTGGQNTGTTEDGAYTLNGALTSEALYAGTRNPGASWVIPSENEWYKAAYHKNDGPTGNYWDYPTSTDAVPYSDQPPGSDAPSPSNTANFIANDWLDNGYDDGYAVSGGVDLIVGLNLLTDAGAYAAAPSPYGTFDQGGNVWEWTEFAFHSNGVRQVRGGSYDQTANTMLSSVRNYAVASSDESWSIGFRVAMVPEPASVALLALGIPILLWRKSRGGALGLAGRTRSSTRNIVTYQLLLCASLCFAGLAAIAAPARADILYAVDIGRIVRFTSSGVGSVFANSVGATDLTGIAFDSAGNLYAANYADSTIEKFTPGGVGSIFASTGLSLPTGLAFDSAGNLYAANQGTNTIEKFTPDGVGSTFADTGLYAPTTGLAFDSAGNLYAATLNNTIEKFTPDGVRTLFATTFINNPSALAFDSAGDLYVAHSTPFFNLVLRISPAGVVSTFAAGVPSLGLAFDSAGDLYTADWLNSTVIRYSPEGGVGSIFASNGILDSPRGGLAFTDDAGVPLPLTNQVPETSTFFLGTAGLASLAAFYWRRRRLAAREQSMAAAASRRRPDWS